MATIILPRSLLALFPAAPRRCDVEAATVAEAIERLDALAPGIRDRIVDAGPVIREHVKVFVDQEPAALGTPLRADSTLHVIPAVSGGAHQRFTIHEALGAWRSAERRWEATNPIDPGYRQASIDVIAAWLAYHAPSEASESGSFVLVADEDQRYVAVSDGVRAILGYEPADLLGRRIEDLAPPDLAATTPAQWQQFMTDGRQDGEFRLMSADGREVPLHFQARAHYPIARYHLSRLWPVAGASGAEPSQGDLIEE
jgi:PAS domain S-box-containing protein